MTVWHASRAKLGETPLWSALEQALYWIDCDRPSISRRGIASGDVRTWRAPCRVGGIALRAGGGVVAILQTGIVALSAGLDDPRAIAPSPIERDHLVLHEARCDPLGRLWVGTLNQDFAGRPGGMTLYRLDGDRLIEQPPAAGGDVANGMAWNRAGTIFYLADSVARTIWRYDYERASGTISNRRIFAQFDERDGYPDGAAVDAEDGYWVAMCGGGKVLRLDPHGHRDLAITVPTALPTAVAFGGPALDRMFVTSIGDHRLLPGHLEGPHDGAIFELYPGTTGLAEPLFAEAPSDPGFSAGSVS